MSKLVTMSADEATATVAAAAVSDIVTTALSTTKFVTGTYGLIQRAGLVGFGMALQNNRLGRGWNPISAS